MAPVITLLLITVLHFLALDVVCAQTVQCYDENLNAYSDGDEVKLDCNTCTCLNSQWHCTEMACSDPCFSFPCLNGGSCSKVLGNYDCICPRNYTGQNCENKVPENVCYDGKNIILNGETFTYGICNQECQCVNGSIICDRSGCPKLNCENQVYSPMYCCPACWPDEKPGFCPETSLTPDIGTCEETCRHDWNCTGDKKCCFNGCGLSCTNPQRRPTALCASYPCKNGGVCIDIFSTEVICRCPPGFHGELCEIPDRQPCYSDGTWYRDGQRHSKNCLGCLCNDGFLECYNECAEKRGECPNRDNFYLDNFYLLSDECSHDNDCLLEMKCCSGFCSEPDLSRLSCLSHGMHLQNGESYHEICQVCVCEEGTLNCNSSLCDNGKPGSCPALGSSPDICTSVTECERDMDCPGFEKCCHNGCVNVCVKPIEADVSSPCFFEDSWHGDGKIVNSSNSRCGDCFCLNSSVVCRNPICPESHCDRPFYVDSQCCPMCTTFCEETTCENGGICQEQTATYVCHCADGYKGPNCEQLDAIDVSCHNKTCENGGICTGFEDPPCICNLGFTGQYCEDVLRLCESSPCQNGGTCYGFASYPCFCPPGYNGEFCEDISDIVLPTNNTDEEDDIEESSYKSEKSSSEEDVQCDEMYCFNDGTCSSNNGYNYCNCPEHIYGEFCEIVSPCRARPCQHGGTCNYFYDNAYSCTCPSGTSGANCETVHQDTCADSPCVNFGSCNEFKGAADCSCVPGYTGRFCQLVVDEHRCSDGTRLDACLFDPCHVANCPGNPFARCESNYCGCIAEFYDEDGALINCHDCPAEDVVTCVLNPCDVTICKNHIYATCRVNNCGQCKAEFYDEHGNLLNCETTCSYKKQIYNTNDQRDHEDACNTCTCTKEALWICTKNKCPELVVVQMGFAVDLDFQVIQNDIKIFKEEIISQLSSMFGIGENNLKDVQIHNGSVIIEFKLVNKDDIDPQELADVMFEKLNSREVEFDFDNQTISVIRGSVKTPEVIKTSSPDDEMSDDFNNAIIVICALVLVTVVMATIIIVFRVYAKKPDKTDNQTSPKTAQTISEMVIYDKSNGATAIQGVDNPTFIDIESAKKS